MHMHRVFERISNPHEMIVVSYFTYKYKHESVIWAIRRTERARKTLQQQRRDVIIAGAQKSVRAVVALAQFNTDTCAAYMSFHCYYFMGATSNCELSK